MNAKFESFGLHTMTINGHLVEETADAIDQAKVKNGKPHMIIANTIKGRGVSYFETWTVGTRYCYGFAGLQI